MPACVRGTFAGELDEHLPPLALPHVTALRDAPKLDRSIEPGCVLPFRKEPSESLLDAGRIVARVTGRTLGKTAGRMRPLTLGHGTMRVGRGAMELRVHDHAGDDVLVIAVQGARVTVAGKGRQPFATDVDLAGDTPLPFPLDALVAALGTCDGDVRLGASDDGNTVEAQRGGMQLWRSRWMPLDGASAVDTSVLCDPNDARLAWRIAEGDTLPMLVVASKRSPLVLLIEKETPAWTEDATDPGMGAGER